jgi:hypothetical protein
MDIVGLLIDPLATEFVVLTKAIIRFAAKGDNSISSVFLLKQTRSPLVVGGVFGSVGTGEPKVFFGLVSGFHIWFDDGVQSICGQRHVCRIRIHGKY